jgi:hypothetical protein
MPDDLNIQYFHHHEIDKTKWDRCMSEARNGLIYGYSFYLDRMSKHWDALVVNDYQTIMPLTWNKKFGIHYLYQPAFTANLGVFGNNLSEKMISSFIQSIPSKFRLIEISLNAENNIDSSFQFMIARTNYVLPLHRDYPALFNNFRENHRRNIQKAQQAGCVVKKDISVQEVIALNKIQMKNKTSITRNDYANFENLFFHLSGQMNAITYSVVDSHDKLLASCVFFFSNKKAYYILVGNHPEGRSRGASHALIDAFIKDHAGRDITLDFEGSDIESLGQFYNGFGAIKETYPAIRWSRLPWWVKWIKH